MEFKKERNFIVAYDGEEKQGAWNILTGEFIGKRGTVVKSVPRCFVYENLTGDILGRAVKFYRDNSYIWQNLYGNSVYQDKYVARFESLISVGLLPYTVSDLASNIRLTKDVVNYCKERGVYFYATDVNNYLATKQYKDYLAGKPDWVKDVFTILITEGKLPIDYIKKMLDRIILEHVYKYLIYTPNIAKFITKYYKKSIALYGEVKVVPNIFSNYINLLYLYDEYENTRYNELLNKHNNKSWLYFENDTFVVRPLLTKEEFHAEAEAQNNCVERMCMGKVKDGETHVVVVRRKTDPDILISLVKWIIAATSSSILCDLIAALPPKKISISRNSIRNIFLILFARNKALCLIPFFLIFCKSNPRASA